MTITNFIVHPDIVQGNEARGQRTEVDILAVRFPYRRELFNSDSGEHMQDHEVFNPSDNRIDIIIAEVKRGKCKLNRPWTNVNYKNIDYILYAIGAFDKDSVSKVADSLYQNLYYTDEKFRVRFFAICEEENDELSGKVKQLTWKELLRFIYKRFLEYKKHKAQHDQWDSVGKLLYTISTNCSQEEFIDIISKAMGI